MVCFLTPSIFFRIAPILALEFQEEQPGTFNCIILSAAKTVEEKSINMKQKRNPNIFFILYPHFIYYVHPETGMTNHFRTGKEFSSFQQEIKALREGVHHKERRIITLERKRAFSRRELY